MNNTNNPTKMIILHNTRKNTAIPNVEDVGVAIIVIIDAITYTITTTYSHNKNTSYLCNIPYSYTTILFFNLYHFNKTRLYISNKQISTSFQSNN